MSEEQNTRITFLIDCELAKIADKIAELQRQIDQDGFVVLGGVKIIGIKVKEVI